MIGLELVRDGGTLGMWPLGTAIGNLIATGDVDGFGRAMGEQAPGLTFGAAGMAGVGAANRAAAARGRAAAHAQLDRVLGRDAECRANGPASPSGRRVSECFPLAHLF